MTPGYADTPVGRLHHVRTGDGPPVLLLHQTPRSVDEYVDVQPLLAAAGYTAIALDTPGYGGSERPRGTATIEAYADAALALLDALRLPRATLVGHHTGGVIALEAAARAPHRVDTLVLSSTPWLDADARAARAAHRPGPVVAPRDDGGHLIDLWHARAPFYPPGRPDLLTRYVRDALRAHDPEDGHRAVSAYRMEERVSRVSAPTLLIGADADPYAWPDLPRLRAALPHASVRVVPGGGVPLPDQVPGAFADAVIGFLKELP